MNLCSRKKDLGSIPVPVALRKSEHLPRMCVVYSRAVHTTEASECHNQVVTRAKRADITLDKHAAELTLSGAWKSRTWWRESQRCRTLRNRFNIKRTCRCRMFRERDLTTRDTLETAFAFSCAFKKLQKVGRNEVEGNETKWIMERT